MIMILWVKEKIIKSPSIKAMLIGWEVLLNNNHLRPWLYIIKERGEISRISLRKMGIEVLLMDLKLSNFPKITEKVPILMMEMGFLSHRNLMLK
jgi:hypothetical protein